MTSHLAVLRRRGSASAAVVLGVALTGCGGSGGGGGGGGGPPPPPATVVIDVTSADLSGAFTLAGLSFPASVFDAGLVGLSDPGGGFAPLGRTSDGAYTQRVVAGTYDVEYLSTATGPFAPHNPRIAVQTAADLSFDQTFPVDVPRVYVTPVFTLNNGPFPASVYDYGELHLVPLAGGEPVYLGRSDQVAAPVPVVPGTYDVEWRYVTGPTVPANRRAVVVSAVAVQQNGVLPVNVLSATATCVLTLDGAPFPPTPLERGRVLLRRPGTPDEVDLGTTNAALSKKVVPTVYDVVYTHESGGIVPRNEDVRIAQGVPIPVAGVAFPVNVVSGLVTLQPGLNGGPFPNSAWQRGDLYFRGASPLDVFPMGPTNVPALPAVRVVLGVYDVLYRHVAGDLVPRNPNAVVQQGVGVAGNIAFPVPVTSVSVTGSFRLNGAAFPSSPSASASIRLRSPSPGDEFSLGPTHVAPAAVAVVAGTYDVLYEAQALGGDVPWNQGYLLQQAVSLVTSQTLAVDVTSRAANVQLRLDGASFPTAASAAADFHLVDPATKRMFRLVRSTGGSTQPVVLIPDTYDVVYESLGGGGGSVPSNLFTSVDTLTLP